MDQKKRKEIYDRAQIMILENVPHLWLFSADTIDFTQTSVKGFKQHPTTLLYGFEGVWLDKAVTTTCGRTRERVRDARSPATPEDRALRAPASPAQPDVGEV